MNSWTGAVRIEICMRSFSHMVWNDICDIGIRIIFFVKLQGFEIKVYLLIVRREPGIE